MINYRRLQEWTRSQTDSFRRFSTFIKGIEIRDVFGTPNTAYVYQNIYL